MRRSSYRLTEFRLAWFALLIRLRCAQPPSPLEKAFVRRKVRILSYCYNRFPQYPHNSGASNFFAETLFAISPQQQNKRFIAETIFAISSQQYNKQLFRRNGLAKTLGAQVIIDLRVAVSRESREERALGLSPLLFFFGYFLKIQKVTKLPT